MAAKEKINLLEVIPCRSEHITAEREGETIVLSFPRFKYPVSYTHLTLPTICSV